MELIFSVLKWLWEAAGTLLSWGLFLLFIALIVELILTKKELDKIDKK